MKLAPEELDSSVVEGKRIPTDRFRNQRVQRIRFAMEEMLLDTTE
jgi:hypothetical protein